MGGSVCERKTFSWNCSHCIVTVQIPFFRYEQRRRAYAATNGLLLKIAGEVLMLLNLAGELPLLKIADDEVFGEQENLGQQGEAGEVLLLQIAGGEVLGLAGVREHLAGPQAYEIAGPQSGVGGATTLWASRSRAGVGVMPYASGSRSGGVQGAAPGNMGEEHEGKKIGRGKSNRGIDVNSYDFHLVGIRLKTSYIVEHRE
jgi:hypothetical protein